MDTQALYKTISTTISVIDNELIQTNKTGVYFAPELYIAFCIGRDIYKNRVDIFQTDQTEWLREHSLGNGGPSDIVFKTADTYTVIELKLRDNINSYNADIEKLKRITQNSNKFFCVLLDSFTLENDNRLFELEKKFCDSLKPIGHSAFPTWNNWYQKQIFCNFNLYQIK